MSEKKRFVDKREDRYRISELRVDDPNLIVCSKCEKMAKILPDDTSLNEEEIYKIICSNCNTVKVLEEKNHPHSSYAPWMHVSCCGEQLSACNRRELELLEGFVEAELREHVQDKYGYANTSYANRLPKWIKSKKNRKKILDCLAKLRVLGGLEALER